MGRMKYFNDKQLDRLSEITGNLGLLFLASFVFTGAFGQEVDEVKAGFGLLLTFAAWIVSMVLLKKGRRND